MPKFRVVESDRLDPYWNLVAEECLLDSAGDAAPVLFLWRSAPAVIIGKNQNPWRECNLPWMEREGVLLARRVSGGGAVYHDEGNLNYSFFMPRDIYRADDVFELIISVLRDLGFDTAKVNRTSLAVAGRKISGNAFCFRRNAVLHHGTLLVSADLDRVRLSLESPAWTFDTRATESIRAQVGNLNEWNAAVDMDLLRNAFSARCGRDEGSESIVELLRPEDINNRVPSRSDTDWLYRHTPAFELLIAPSRSLAGLAISVERGIVVRISSGNKEVERAGIDLLRDKPFGRDSLERFITERGTR